MVPCRHCKASGQGKPHRTAFQGKQVSGVSRQVAPFNLQVNFFAVMRSLCHRFHGGAGFAEGFHHGKTPGVFDHCAGQVPVGLGLHRGVGAAEVGNDQHTAEGKQCGHQCDQRRNRAANCERNKYHSKVQIAADKVVDHTNAHGFQGGKAGGDGIQNASGADLPEITERNSL